MGNLKTKATRQEIEKALAAIVQDDSSTTRDKESAFNELYSNNQRQLLVYFLKNVRESETAEDLQLMRYLVKRQAIMMVWIFKSNLIALIQKI